MTVVFSLAAVVGFPLMGVLLAGEPAQRYTKFPPTIRYVQHAEFSLPVFMIVTVLILAAVLPFDIVVWKSRKRVLPVSAHRQRFPWWGRVGAVLCAAAWVLSWTRFRWFAPLQRFTFSPLWLGYILVVNGLTYRRTGHCMLRDTPCFFLLLFPASAAFWWLFEYLNRFVQNWYYVGMGNLTPSLYFWFATLPFSTVLPAVLGTHELLESVPRAGAGLDRFIRIETGNVRVMAWIMLVTSCAGLAIMRVLSDCLFPLLWVSPLIIIISLQIIWRKGTIFANTRQGNWRRVYLLGMAALICGFFWEMWNYLSLAKWMYEIPFVGRFRLFEMPVLGYAGYLTFGLECGVLGDILRDVLSNTRSMDKKRD